MATQLKGLAAIKAFQDEQKAKAEAANRPKAEWLSSVFPKETGDEITVSFLQELDEDSEGYDPEYGVGLIQVEHQAPGPKGFTRRANCTKEDEGECYACERHALNYKEGWRQRSNLYINVLLNGKPYVLSRNANSAFAEALIAEAVDEGSITNNEFRIKKVGVDTGTNWLLKRLKSEAEKPADVKPFNLEETAIRAIPYEKQAEYFGAVYQGTGTDVNTDAMGSLNGSTSTSVDADW
jgi:hypothetical protein